MQKLYRPNVGIMIINDAKKALIGRRANTTHDTWQMPQGGIDKDETPEQAAYREMYEETGIKDTQLLAQSEWHCYDYPDWVAATKYVGQRQKWFLMHYTGTDLAADTARRRDKELENFVWAEPATLPQKVIDFKRAVYEKILIEFAAYLR